MSDERKTPAALLRLGEQLLTRDGWQTIRGLLIFEDPDQVTVYTDQRDDDRTSGWSFALADHVTIRPAPESAGLDRPDRADVPAVGDIAPSRDVTGDRDASTIAKHYETAAWKGDEPGECGAECECGVTYDGFDSLAEAGEFLGRHIKAGNAKPSCPPWCDEHYEGEGGIWNHSSYPQSVVGADVWTGAPMEMAYWAERRDDPDVQETVIVLEVSRLADDIELTPDALRVMAARLIGLADRAQAG